MRRILFCFVLVVPLLSSSERAASVWRPPEPPDVCPDFRVEFALLDVSKSMSSGGFFDAVLDSLRESIDAAPACELMILGTFGVTADIRAAEFLDDRNAREWLKAAMRPLRPNA